MKIAVHITHESVKKIGGIGSVLSGVCNLQGYPQCYEKTLFYGPLFSVPNESRDYFGKSSRILYSSHDSYDSENFADLLTPIAEKYNVDIIYATRKVYSEFDFSKFIEVDVVNIGINRIDHDAAEKFKFKLWKQYGIESNQYENDWDYQQYLRIAVPYLEILTALYGDDNDFFHFAHEYMGVPSALAVLMAERNDKTVFIGHEVTTARAIVESHPGHDVSFYNLLQKSKDKKSLENVFGSQQHNPRSELVKRARFFDHVFAVGDLVKDEYQFLVPEADPEKVKVVYNGVSVRKVTFEQKQLSRSHISEYIETLFNFTPDVIFTHVTRLVISKGIWRDITLLRHMDNIFADKKLKGCYILLSTLITTGRAPEDIYQMERDYGWPVMHQHGWPDLLGYERDVYSQLRLFNATSRAIKAVFINQFGFNRQLCGNRVPADAEFDDIRLASDAELGLSIYEPFGIAQIETVPFGGVAVLSTSCGSAGLLQQKFQDAPIKPYYAVDYITPAQKMGVSALNNLSMEARDKIENSVMHDHAQEIFDIIPTNEQMRRQYLENALTYADRISWDSTAADYMF